jgi:UDP-glucuronate 4-epimerase
MTVIVTGAAGFIGAHVAQALVARGETVAGIDNLSDYYDVRLKRDRIAQLLPGNGFILHEADIADKHAIAEVFARYPETTRVVHLAAQAGVRHSMKDPYAFVTSNVMGHVVMLEAARTLRKLDHFVFASSSSVYGLNEVMPFAEDAQVDTPASLYAATKRADELIGHAYGHLYGMPQTGLRFFTAYGPWGRPDMAYYSFARDIMAGRPITLYDGGAARRDFTYIDDIVSGVLGALDLPPAAGCEVRLLNIGNNHSESVTTLVELLQASLGRKAVMRFEPRPKSDVAVTAASIERIGALTGFVPRTPLAAGIGRFASWFLSYHATATNLECA